MIPILFEDDDVLAVDKPEGLASIPGPGADQDCLLSRLQVQRPQRLYVVHRLDKEASGVILFARHAVAHRYLVPIRKPALRPVLGPISAPGDGVRERFSDRLLNELFEQHQIQKNYLVLVHGAVAKDQGLIDRPIRQFGSGRMGVDPRRGKPSQTAYQVIERLPGYTLLRVQPLTGRRHQIRVHLYSIGHPVVGDLRYGDRTLQSAFPRLMLHAQQVTLRLPSGQEESIEAPVPISFLEVRRRAFHG